jgi:hypothetical protein
MRANRTGARRAHVLGGACIVSVAVALLWWAVAVRARRPVTGRSEHRWWPESKNNGRVWRCARCGVSRDACPHPIWERRWEPDSWGCRFCDTTCPAGSWEQGRRDEDAPCAGS